MWQDKAQDHDMSHIQAGTEDIRKARSNFLTRFLRILDTQLGIKQNRLKTSIKFC